MKYSSVVSDHFHRPQNCGILADATVTGEAENAVCLDKLKLYFQIIDGKIARATYQAEGCVPVLAAGSFLTVYAAGKSLPVLCEMTADELDFCLGGLPLTKKHAAHLIIEALADALRKSNG